MTLIAIGLNHRSAPLTVLERIAVSGDVLVKALAEVTDSEFVNEAVILSTCNRTEVYVHAERFHDAFHDVRDSLSRLSGLPVDEFVDHLYVHYHDEATRHLFLVTAGLDSAILGEHEILGQVKSAWELARVEGFAGPLLGQVFEHAVQCGKRVRTETGIGRSTASLSHAAVSLVTEHLGSLDGRRVLLVGAGEVGASVATALAKSAAVQVEVTNRTDARAGSVAAAVGATTVPLDRLGEAIDRADVIIAATSAPGYLIDATIVSSPASDRTVFLDLGVPRDIDPDVASVPGVDLLVLADLQAFANRGIEHRQKEAVVARSLVSEELERYAEASSARLMAPLVGGLHRRSEQLRAEEVARHARRLASLDDDQREAVDAMTRALVAKLLHEPSVRLKKAAGSHRGERLAEAARELFDLP